MIRGDDVPIAGAPIANSALIAQRPGLMNGFLNLNKPVGVTSRDVVDLIARPLKRSKVKVGHAGTLDPIASGVLVVAIGAATRLVEYVQRQKKTYRAVARLGATSDTLDADGLIVEMPDPPIPTEARIREAIATQVGTILQVPPQYSALKVAGRRAYDLARAGESVDLAARPVVVDRVELLKYEWPTLELEIDCGGGTYIRSILRDVGSFLGCGALMTALVRTRIGPFSIDDALDPTTLDPATIPARLRPPSEAISDLLAITISPEDVAGLLQGRALAAPPGSPAGEVALIGPDGALVALAEVGDGRIQPRKVLISR